MGSVGYRRCWQWCAKFTMSMEQPVLPETVRTFGMQPAHFLSDLLHHTGHQRIAHEESAPTIWHASRVVVREHVDAFQFDRTIAVLNTLVPSSAQP